MKRRSGLNFSRRRKKFNVPLFKEIMTWVLECAIVIAIAYALVSSFGFRTTVVGNAMQDTLQSEEQIFVNRFVYMVRAPKQGDVVVFLPNGNEKSHYYIKRVVAAGGDTVQIVDGVIYVNGAPLEEVHFSGTISDPGVAAEEQKLAADECFVLGDNPGGSEDSRFANIGNVKSEYIIGKAWYKIWPLSDAGFVD